MKKTRLYILLFIVLLTTLLVAGCSDVKEKQNFIKAYAEILTIQAKEEIAKNKNQLFNKADSLRKVFEKYDIDEEAYREKLDKYLSDMNDWSTIQDSVTAILKSKLNK